MSDIVEILDVIDENNNVLYQLPKSDVHAKNLLHREIGVLVVDENNRVLLQQRSFKKKSFPGAWTVTAVGHVPAGMTPEQAAHKELQEELGFDTVLSFIELRKYISENHTSLGFLFLGKINSDTKLTIQEEEVEQAKFVSEEELEQMLLDGSIDYHTKETIERFHKSH